MARAVAQSGGLAEAAEGAGTDPEVAETDRNAEIAEAAEVFYKGLCVLSALCV